MRALKLFFLFIKVNLINEITYRVNLLVQSFDSLIQLLTSLGWLAIAFNHTRTINGWSAPELTALVGIFLMVQGIVSMIIQPSLWRLMDDIRLGRLDHLLLKPIDAQLQASMREIRITRITDLVFGILTVGLAILKGAGTGHLTDSAPFLLLFPSALLLTYSFMFILAISAFWFVRVDNILFIYFAIFQAGRWPVQIYPIPFQRILTFVIPVAFIVTVPAEAIAGRATFSMALLSVALAVTFFMLSRRLWKIGLRRYAGASS